MNSINIQKARGIIRKNPHLIWYTTDYKNLSQDAIFEAVLNYGDWDDFLKLQEIFGLKTSHTLFKKAVGKKRSNIRPETKNYFEKYFAKYA